MSPLVFGHWSLVLVVGLFVCHYPKLCNVAGSITTRAWQSLPGTAIQLRLCHQSRDCCQSKGFQDRYEARPGHLHPKRRKLSASDHNTFGNARQLQSAEMETLK